MQLLRADILFGLVCCLGAISEETGCTPDGTCASSGSSVLQRSIGRSIAQENELRRNLSATMGTLVLEGYNDGNQALLSVAGKTMAVYEDLGTGKCLTKAGKDPRHSYRGGMGRMCQKLCDSSSTCGGYSVSRHNNCLLWNEAIDNLRGGGGPWSGAHCFVQGTTLTTTTTPPTTTTTPTQPQPTTVTTTTSDAVPVIPVVVDASEADNIVLKVKLVK